MDYVSLLNVTSPSVCLFSADDSYPAQLLCWLQQQAEIPVKVERQERELEGA